MGSAHGRMTNAYRKLVTEYENIPWEKLAVRSDASMMILERPVGKL